MIVINLLLNHNYNTIDIYSSIKPNNNRYVLSFDHPDCCKKIINLPKYSYNKKHVNPISFPFPLYLPKFHHKIYITAFLRILNL